MEHVPAAFGGASDRFRVGEVADGKLHTKRLQL
jgi:hypothetical protein